MPVPSAFFSKCIFFLLFLIPSISNAQHYEHTTFWGKIIVSKPLSKNWDFQFEYLHRMQNNPRESIWNPFQHVALDEPRIWFNYKQKHYTLLLNPVTYFYSSAFLGKASDFNVKPNTIWQSVVAFETNQKIKKWTVKERVVYEYRWLESLNYVPVGRFRLRGLLQYQLTDKIKLQAYDDVFWNAPPHKLHNNFDQNWASISLQQQINHTFGCEIGYMHNHRVRPNGKEFDEENALTLTFNVKL